MTGWLTIPAALEGDLAKLIEYNTSCGPDFAQQGALAALIDLRGEAVVAELTKGLQTSRAPLLDGLDSIGGIGATHRWARLAPGSAFGPRGLPTLVLCCLAGQDRARRGALAQVPRPLATSVQLLTFFQLSQCCVAFYRYLQNANELPKALRLDLGGVASQKITGRTETVAARAASRRSAYSAPSQL